MGDYSVPQKSCGYRSSVYAEQPIKNHIFSLPQILSQEPPAAQEA